MDVKQPKTKLCAGRTVSYLVQVELEPLIRMPTPVPPRGSPKKLGVVNVKIEAFSSERNVADFVGGDSASGIANARTSVVTEDNDLSGLGAKFTLKAKKPGSSTLYFEGLVQGEYVSYDLPIRVIACKFKVTTISEWSVPGPAGIHVTAISDDAEVKSADEQSPLTGSTSVNWVVSVGAVGGCSETIDVGSSRVEWNGTVDDSDQLALNGTYQTAAGALDALCVGASGESTTGNMSIELTPDPLLIGMSASGGSTSQSQILQGPEATSGLVTIIVVPEEEEQAVSFIPFNPLSGLTDTSGLFEVRLALR
jgi:hypothetical protein